MYHFLKENILSTRPALFLTVEKFTEQEEEGKSYFDGGNRTVWDTVPFYKWEKVQAA